MKKQSLAFRLIALLLAPLSSLNAAAPSSRPNILFILTDDEGLSDVGCYGSDRFKGKTPNIDALAATGLRFTHCFAPPLCCPSQHGALPFSQRRTEQHLAEHSVREG
jgi:arylsulfatase A